MSKERGEVHSYTIDTFLKTMRTICRAKYIVTHREGDTGIGKTLEDLLDIKENSIQAPDLGEIELKATRKKTKKTSGRVTLFTKAPSKKGVNRTVLREKYGYQTNESKQLNDKVNVLFTVLNGKEYNSSSKMKLVRKENRIYINHKKDGLLEDVYWEEEKLTQAFSRKFPSGKLLLVRADSKTNENGREMFWFNEAYLLEGFSSEKMMDGLMSGILDMEIRLGIYKSGKHKGHIHDTGTAIRVSEKDLDACFEKKTTLILE